MEEKSWSRITYIAENFKKLMIEESAIEEWYVVRSQTKRERSAAAYIRKELGLEVVAPQVSFVKSTRRGKVKWREAMFPGYLFVKFVREVNERAVCYAPGVLTLVKFGSIVPSIEASFVESLQDTLTEDGNLTLERIILKGAQYEVSEGPMRGQEGVVVEVLPGGDRVKMLMEFIGGEREVDLDIYQLLLSSRPDL